MRDSPGSAPGLREWRKLAGDGDQILGENGLEAPLFVLIESKAAPAETAASQTAAARKKYFIFTRNSWKYYFVKPPCTNKGDIFFILYE